MTRVPRCFPLIVGFAIVGCQPIETEVRPEEDAASARPSEGSDPRASDAGTEPREDGVSFAPSNVPREALTAATSDWVLNTETCRSKTITIDTVSGEDSCGGEKNGSYVFQTITRTDPDYGELTMGLFVTKNLKIEPDMRVVVVGNRPLVIAAVDSVKIEGTIAATVDSIYEEYANGGGYSGASKFSTGGGRGGGQGESSTSPPGGGGHCGVGGSNNDNTGGKAYGNPTLVPLLGGSAGGGSEYGAGGGGGGAIQIVAGTSIHINGAGVIHVGGGGGDFSVTDRPGGGGGSGGSILLEAPDVSVFGTLAANGGGGTVPGSSAKGSNATPDSHPAKGATSNKGQGGDGGAGLLIDGQHGQGERASGGGAVGRIRINTQSSEATVGAQAVISPALSTPCATQGTLAPL